MQRLVGDVGEGDGELHGLAYAKVAAVSLKVHKQSTNAAAESEQLLPPSQLLPSFPH
jgi:hypothetical protein